MLPQPFLLFRNSLDNVVVGKFCDLLQNMTSGGEKWVQCSVNVINKVQQNF